MNKCISLVLTVMLVTPGLLMAASIEGVVDWAERVTLGTPVSGVVKEVRVQPGQQVRQGDVLLTLDDTDFKAHLAAATAARNKTVHALAEARREWERGQELYARTVTSDRELKLAQIAYSAARADHSAAEAELSMATKALADSVIKAPFDGMIIARHVNPAETVVTRLQSVAMITMGMTGRYHAVARVDAATAAKLQNGMAVEVKTAGNKYKGSIVFVAVEPDKGVYTVKAGFTTGDILQIGTAATIITP